MSLRETARILNCSYMTVYKKFKWMGNRAKEFHLNQNLNATDMYFDEMETIEHTKLKPLSIALAVNQNYQILGVQVGTIPAKGKIAWISRKKYGHRKNESKAITKALLEQIKIQISSENLNIHSDTKPEYLLLVKQSFPNSTHLRFVSAENKEKRREQKYLKAEKHIPDPLFKINHMCARLRDHIKRLTRRSWCTTKLKEHLELHLYLYLAKTNNYRFI